MKHSTTGIPGILAFYSLSPGNRILSFVAQWYEEGRHHRIQRSSAVHGILGALELVLTARAKATGALLPPPAEAWKIIKRTKGWTDTIVGIGMKIESEYKIDAGDLVAMRKRLGLSQAEFWVPLGVTQSAGSRYEGTRKLPKPIKTLIGLAHGNTPIKMLAALRGVSVEAVRKGK